MSLCMLVFQYNFQYLIIFSPWTGDTWWMDRQWQRSLVPWYQWGIGDLLGRRTNSNESPSRGSSWSLRMIRVYRILSIYRTHQRHRWQSSFRRIVPPTWRRSRRESSSSCTPSKTLTHYLITIYIYFYISSVILSFNVLIFTINKNTHNRIKYGNSLWSLTKWRLPLHRIHWRNYQRVRVRSMSSYSNCWEGRRQPASTNDDDTLSNIHNIRCQFWLNILSDNGKILKSITLLWDLQSQFCLNTSKNNGKRCLIQSCSPET